MIFCISCGARNEDGAVFCLSCGQTLYVPSRAGPISPRRAWLRAALIGTCTLLGAALIAIFTLHFKQSGDGGRTESIPLSELRPADPVPETDKAVLTIIASDRHGSAVSQGSGFILTSDGLAGTNYHVIEGTSGAVAECCDGREFVVHAVEAVDFKKDLVLFQLYERGASHPPQGLPHVTMAPSQGLTVGEKVIAIGSPQGLENTVSDGILSAIREFDSIRYLQITAPISPGSSGGPVFDSAGQMIGIATFQLRKGQNLNFAVAAENLNSLLGERMEMPIAGLQALARGTKAGQNNTAITRADENESSSDALTGQYAGIVHNLSADLSAEFGIVVNDSEGILSGCMVVKQPLFGSGPLAGSVVGQIVSFKVTSAIGTITFTGREGRELINGKYTVEHDAASKEVGTFTLSKVDSKGLEANFDRANCPTDAEIHK